MSSKSTNPLFSQFLTRAPNSPSGINTPEAKLSATFPNADSVPKIEQICSL
jgi:hypothetical protein